MLLLIILLFIFIGLVIFTLLLRALIYSSCNQSFNTVFGAKIGQCLYNACKENLPMETFQLICNQLSSCKTQYLNLKDFFIAHKDSLIASLENGSMSTTLNPQDRNFLQFLKLLRDATNCNSNNKKQWRAQITSDELTNIIQYIEINCPVNTSLVPSDFVSLNIPSTSHFQKLVIYLTMVSNSSK